VTALTVQLRRKGVITLPVQLGAFLLVPRVSKVAYLGDRVAEVMQEEGVSTGELLKVLEEERETYYREHYG